MEKDIEQIIAELELHNQVDTAGNWKQLSGRIQRHTLRVRMGRFVCNAAAILLLPALVSTYLLFSKVNEWSNLPVEMTEICSAPGIVSRVSLPDGSEVWLNSGSSLSYPTRFTDKKREVHLVGEAYFKVKSDPSNRFDVIASDRIRVSAYGTEFNVKAYADEGNIKATLAEGHIEASDRESTKTYTVSPGNQIVFNTENGEIEQKEINLAVVTGWKDGKTIFRRATMSEITRRLARQFNVSIILEGEELYDYEYSATFTTESLNDILYLLEKSAPIKCRMIEPEQTEDYSYSKRTVVISILNKK